MFSVFHWGQPDQIIWPQLTDSLTRSSDLNWLTSEDVEQQQNPPTGPFLYRPPMTTSSCTGHQWQRPLVQATNDNVLLYRPPMTMSRHTEHAPAVQHAHTNCCYGERMDISPRGLLRPTTTNDELLVQSSAAGQLTQCQRINCCRFWK